MCLLTSIVPVGNLERDLTNLLKIKEQAVENNVSLIFVIDDQNPNSLLKARKDLCRRDSSLVKVLSFNGRNPGGARNIGLKEVSSEWVHFCDSDDEPNFREILRIIVGQSSSTVDAFVCNYRIETNKESLRTVISRTSNLFDVAINPGLWRWVIRSNSASGIEFPDSRLGEDQVFLARFLGKGPKICVLGKSCIYIYCLKNPNSLSRELDLISLEKSIEAFEEIDLRAYRFVFKIFVSLMYFRLSYTYMAGMQKSKADRYLFSMLTLFTRCFTFAKRSVGFKG